MRARAVVVLSIAAGALAACGGHGSAAPTSPTTVAPSPTGTSDDSCYLVLLDLQSIADGGTKATVLAQMTQDAATGSPALKAAVASYEKSGDSAAITAVCR